MKEVFLIVVLSLIVLGSPFLVEQLKMRDSIKGEGYESMQEANNNGHYHEEPNAILQSCSSSQINIGYNAISSCQVQSLEQTANCISTFIQSKLNQKWNIFTQFSTNSDSVAFWYFGSCYLSLNNYGRYNRAYIMWPVTNLTSSSPNSINQREALTSTQMAFNGNSCLQWRTVYVNKIIQQCDIESSYQSAQCIISSLKQNINENWNSFVSNSLAQLSALQGWYYDGCSVDIANFGKYKRHFIVWKAYPST